MARWEKSEKQKNGIPGKHRKVPLFWGATGVAGFKGFQVDGNHFPGSFVPELGRH